MKTDVPPATKRRSVEVHLRPQSQNPATPFHNTNYSRPPNNNVNDYSSKIPHNGSASRGPHASQTASSPAMFSPVYPNRSFSSPINMNTPPPGRYNSQTPQMQPQASPHHRVDASPHHHQHQRPDDRHNGHHQRRDERDASTWHRGGAGARR